MLSWAPNHSAFQYTFQVCYEGSRQLNSGTSSIVPPWWDPGGCMATECCRMINAYKNTYGEFWAQSLWEAIQPYIDGDPETPNPPDPDLLLFVTCCPGAIAWLSATFGE